MKARHYRPATACNTRTPPLHSDRSITRKNTGIPQVRSRPITSQASEPHTSKTPRRISETKETAAPQVTSRIPTKSDHTQTEISNEELDPFEESERIRNLLLKEFPIVIP